MSPWVIGSESKEISGDKNPTCHTSQRKSEIKCKSEAKKQKEDIEPEANFISVSESLVLPIESGTPPGLGVLCGACRQRVGRGREGRATPHPALPIWTRPASPFMHLLLPPEHRARLLRIPIPCCTWPLQLLWENVPPIKIPLLFWHMTLEMYPQINKMKKLWHWRWRILVLSLTIKKCNISGLPWWHSG